MRISSSKAFEQFTLLYDWSHIYNATCMDSINFMFSFGPLPRWLIIFSHQTLLRLIHESDKPFTTGEIRNIISKRDKLYQHNITCVDPDTNLY